MGQVFGQINRCHINKDRSQLHVDQHPLVKAVDKLLYVLAAIDIWEGWRGHLPILANTPYFFFFLFLLFFT